MTDTTDCNFLLGAVEEFCEKRVRDAVLAERERVIKYLLGCAHSHSATDKTLAQAIKALAREIEDGEHLT